MLAIRRKKVIYLHLNIFCPKLRSQVKLKKNQKYFKSIYIYKDLKVIQHASTKSEYKIERKCCLQNAIFIKKKFIEDRKQLL